jgi:hypothetical protein
MRLPQCELFAICNVLRSIFGECRSYNADRSTPHDVEAAQVFLVVEANTAAANLATCESSTNGRYYTYSL